MESSSRTGLAAFHREDRISRRRGWPILDVASVVSVVLGRAAQNTLGNLIAGFSLVLDRPVRVGNRVQLTTPLGLTTAVAERVSLGNTVLRDVEGREIVVPNSVLISNIVIRIGVDDSGEPLKTI